ncbi:MAG: hypothetical protein Q8L28_00490 [bacterium]|nr:hypothetical protein [bacterium]
MDKASIFYHDIFDFPLSRQDFVKWSCRAGSRFARKVEIVNKSGYFFVKGREDEINKRISRKKTSAKKMKIAKRASKIISRVPTVKMVAVTGSLAMMNAGINSDIDLMIITKRGTLWTSRAFVYLLICLFDIKLRRPNELAQKDKLCLNIWIDESDLNWSKADRNVYTAHEIAQIVPLVNKNNTYERFLYQNRWILKFWPNAVGIRNQESGSKNLKYESMIHDSFPLIQLLEKLAFWFQYQYMRSKLTRETVTKTRALFHPQDWGKIVLSRFTT